jgi:hypothetical protein
MLARRGDGHVQRARQEMNVAADIALSDDEFGTLTAVGEQNA